MNLYRIATLLYLFLTVFVGNAILSAQGVDTKASGAKPIPLHQVTPLANHQSSFSFEGQELTRMNYAPLDRRPFLFPVLTEHGVSLTRMGHPHDPWGHSHHNSIWITHSNVDGVDFWGDRAQKGGRISLHEIPRDSYQDSDSMASMKFIAHWNADAANKTLLKETRTIAVKTLKGRSSWMLTIDSRFEVPDDSQTTLSPTAFGLAAVRMAKSIGVTDGGGRILNSLGQLNEKEVFRKPAKWCDYSGRISNHANGMAGITLMNHPSNPSHPTPFHVRDDGWMGACLNLENPIVINNEFPLVVRYGFWIHDGIPTLEEIEEQWSAFAKGSE
jgi:hypothetical protein